MWHNDGEFVVVVRCVQYVLILLENPGNIFEIIGLIRADIGAQLVQKLLEPWVRDVEVLI